VSREDAAAMADALQRALADPGRAAVEVRIRRELNGEKASSEPEKSLVIDGEFVPEFIAFLRTGSFSIW
jgi:anti-sigma factor RsiW